MSGILYIVGTPIGNLKDITFRAIEVLKNVDIIAAEDTRNTKKLLNHYGIDTGLISYHEHNKLQRGEYIVEHYLLQEKNVALVSDAGMPMISDPGMELISLCIEQGIEVTTVPAATALVTAAVLSGMVKGSFIFEGFLPSDKSKKKEVLRNIEFESRAVILYEAPHKLLKTLALIKEVLGDKRRIAFCRELTKLHEEVLRFEVGEAIEYYSVHEPRGEFVLVIEGCDKKNLEQASYEEYAKMDLREHMSIYLEQGFDKKEAMKMVAKDRGITKKEVYKSLLFNSFYLD